MGEYNGNEAVTQHDQTEQQSNHQQLNGTGDYWIDRIQCVSKCPNDGWNQTGNKRVSPKKSLAFALLRKPGFSGPASARSDSHGIAAYLHQGGSLISVGGAPFKRPVRYENGAWVVESDSTAGAFFAGIEKEQPVRGGVLAWSYGH